MTTTYRLDLQYQGFPFHGWSAQEGQHTVSENLSRAYQELTQDQVFVDGSGRTDAGVHARHQIAVLKTERFLPAQAILMGVRRYLPEGIRVFRVSVVDENWRPRPAVLREYRYFLWKTSEIPLFLQDYLASTHLLLDLERMRSAADLTIGERDFSLFRAAGCTARHGIRRIERIEIVDAGGYLEFRILGNAFLRQMVRILVGTLVEVGCKKILVESLPERLLACDRRLAGPTMPPQGLFLWRIQLAGDTDFPIPPTIWEQVADHSQAGE